MDVNIICSLIDIGGSIITAFCAALFTTLFAKGIFEKNIKPVFQTYSDKNHNLSDFISKAQHNIVIFAVSGNTLLKRHRPAIEERIQHGVSVYYLLLNKEQLLEMERYMHGDDAKDESVYSFVKNQLDELNKNFPGKLQFYEFPYFMTASYVGVDIPFGEEKGSYFPDAVIQVMQYQYGRRARVSPITYFSLKRNRDQFDGTVASMIEMWDTAKRYSKVAPAQK